MTSILTGVFASQISGHLFSGPTGSYDALATVTVPSGGASSITFSAIPQTGYKHLQIRALAREASGGSAGFQSTYVYFNGDTAANYSTHRIWGDGATAYSDGYGSTNIFVSGFPAGSGLTSGIFGVGVIDILDYTNVSKNKTLRAIAGGDMNGSSGFISQGSGAWYNTSSITSITLQSTNTGRNFAQYSQFSLYGVK